MYCLTERILLLKKSYSMLYPNVLTILLRLLYYKYIYSIYSIVIPIT